MNETRLYILCGLPFAGKTTLAKELVKRFGFYVDISESEARQRLLDSRVMQQRYDVRDDNFTLLVTCFEPPTLEEQ